MKSVSVKHEHLLKIKFLRTAPNYELFRPTYSAHSMVRIKFVPKIAIFIVKFTSYINIQRRGFLTLHWAVELNRINSSPARVAGGGGRLGLESSKSRLSALQLAGCCGLSGRIYKAAKNVVFDHGRELLTHE